jgi:putative membrane protein
MTYWKKMVLLGTGTLILLNGCDSSTNGWFDWSDGKKLLMQMVTTIIFLIIGLFFFALSDWLVERVLPRSLRKGIEEDKNVALAIVIAAVILGVALIVSAAIRG